MFILIHFMPTFIFAQSLDEVKENVVAVEEVDSLKGEQQNRPNRIQGQYGSCTDESPREEYRVRSTPVDDLENLSSSGRWAMSLPTITSWLNSTSSSTSNFLPICSPRGRIGSDLDESDRPLLRDSRALKTGCSVDHRELSRVRGVTLENDRGRNVSQSFSTIIWNEVKKQAEKFADTDMQLAGLI